VKSRRQEAGDRTQYAGAGKQEAVSGSLKPVIFNFSASCFLKENLDFTFFSISNSFGTVFCYIIETT